MKVGQHQLERFSEICDVVVAVVQIVNDADVHGLVVLTQEFTHRHEIGGFTAPATMVVEAEFAAESFGALNQGQYRFGRGSNLCLLYVCLWIG